MSDILDRLLGQPHTTSEPPEVTAQREALMGDVALEIRRLRELVGQHDAMKAMAKQMRQALDAYEAAEEKAAEKAAADTKAAAAKAEEARHAAQQHPQNQPHR
jgi:ClpP class serine protease